MFNLETLIVSSSHHLIITKKDQKEIQKILGLDFYFSLVFFPFSFFLFPFSFFLFPFSFFLSLSRRLHVN